MGDVISQPRVAGWAAFTLTILPASGALADDFPADATTTGAIALGVAVTGEIEAPDDVDWFALPTDLGEVRITVAGSGANGLAEPRFRILDETGSELVFADSDGGIAEATVDTAAAASLFVAVDGFGTATGTYLIAAAPPVVETEAAAPASVDDDLPALRDTPATLTPDTDVSGAIEAAGDMDWIALPVSAGMDYTVSLTADGEPGLPAASLAIVSGSGTALTRETGSLGTLAATARVTADGTMYVEVAGFGDGTGGYALSVTATETPVVAPAEAAVAATDDYPAGRDTSGLLMPGIPTTADLEEAFDTDWFALDVVSGVTYTVDMEGFATDGGSLIDPFVAVLDNQLNELAFNDDGGEGRNARATFTPAVTGRVFVEASAYADYFGTYTLTVTEVADEPPAAADDFAADPTTTGTIAVDGTVTGTLEESFDEDWFAADLTAGATYRIDLRGLDSGGGTLGDPLLVVYDTNGVEIDRNDDGGDSLDSSLLFEAPTSGRFYFGARAFGSLTGTYQLSLAAAETTPVPQADDFADNFGTLGVVTPGNDVFGQIEVPGDRDWLAVPLAAGSAVTVSVTADSGNGPALGAISIALLDGAQTVLASHDSPSGAATVTYEAPSAATVFLEIAGLNGATGGYRAGVLTSTIATQPVGPADDYPGDSSTQSVIVLGQPANGELETGSDADWFGVDLSPGDTVLIELRGQSSGGGTLEDPFLYVYDPRGTEIGRNDDGGTDVDSRLMFTATESGRHYVAAESFGDTSGTYTISVSLAGGTGLAGDDYPADASTTGSVGVGSSITGRIDFTDDEDWIALTASPGQPVQIDLEGSPTGRGDLRDPLLRIVDGSGMELAWNDDGGEGLNSQITYQPISGSTVYIVAGAYGGQTGSYTVTISPAEPEQPESGK